MAQTMPVPAADAEPLHVPLWAWFLVAASALVLYLVTMDNTLLGHAAETVHELFHDARHFVGAPCH